MSVLWKSNFMRVECLSPAKINLFLRIVGKRENGYHELVSLICPIDLYDRMSFTFHTSSMMVTCSDPNIPDGHENLAFQAAEKFFQAIGSDDSVSIEIEKKIPAGAGLGGGSSNAAVVLSTLNQQYQHPLSKEKLHQLALSLGTDIPFFLSPQTTLVSGIGECLHPLCLEILKPMCILYPGFPVSTSWVYKNYNFSLTRKNLADIKTDLISRYKKSQEKMDWLSDVANDLEEITFKRYPELLEIKKELTAQGAIRTLMSGSGSSLVGVFNHTADCQKACENLNQHPSWRVFACHVNK